MLKLNKRRLWLLCVLLLLLVPAVMAQETSGRSYPVRRSRERWTRIICVQVYTLQGSAGQVLTLTAS